MKQNRLNADWQGAFPNFRRVGVYIDPSSALSQERAMEVDKVAMNCSGAWAVSQFGIFAVWIAGGRPALVYLMPNNHQASAVQSL
jgi:hypothetical protein